MKTLAELKAIREKMQSQVNLRAEDHNHTRVVVGMATCGIASGARPGLTTLSNLVQEKGLTNKVSVTQTGCSEYTGPGSTVKRADRQDLRYTDRLHRLMPV